MMISPVEFSVQVKDMPPLGTYEMRKQFALEMLGTALRLGWMHSGQATSLARGITSGLFAVMCRVDSRNPVTIVVTLTQTENTVYV